MSWAETQSTGVDPDRDVQRFGQPCRAGSWRVVGLRSPFRERNGQGHESELLAERSVLGAGIVNPLEGQSGSALHPVAGWSGSSHGASCYRPAAGDAQLAIRNALEAEGHRPVQHGECRSPRWSMSSRRSFGSTPPFPMDR